MTLCRNNQETNRINKDSQAFSKLELFLINEEITFTYFSGVPVGIPEGL